MGSGEWGVGPLLLLVRQAVRNALLGRFSLEVVAEPLDDVAVVVWLIGLLPVAVIFAVVNQ